MAGWIFVFYGPYADESHHTNRQWRAFKSGKLAYDPTIAFRFLNVDVEFRMSLEEKSLEEFRQWYPDLRAPDRETNPDHQRIYFDEVSKEEFLWIAGSSWGVYLDANEIERIVLMKG